MMENKSDKGYYVYILHCSDGSLYTGWTMDVKRRLEEHQSGQGAKYTRCRRPVSLCYTEEASDKKEAMRREYAIKRMSRQQKLALIAFMHQDG